MELAWLSESHGGPIGLFFPTKFFTIFLKNKFILLQGTKNETREKLSKFQIFVNKRFKQF